MKLIAMPGDWSSILQHLLPMYDSKEHAAFMYGAWNANVREIRVIEHDLIQANDLESQKRDHLELTSSARQRQIKRAHDLGACLIEFHSHPFSRHASFSHYDIENLRETVPHMLWRLRGRPYVAIVVARGTFDALVWETEFEKPELLDHIAAGERIVRPTNRSLRLMR